MSDRARFASAVVVGIPLAFLGLMSGLIMMAALLIAVVLTWFSFGRPAFAGLAIALGVTWLVVFLLAAVNCSAPDMPCGATPVDLTPHIVVSAGLVAVGAVAALSGLRAASRVE